MKIDASGVVALVLHFRTPEATLACLQSMAAESVRSVVLVDNSEDGGASLARMRDGLERLRAVGVVVERITPARNLGFAAGVNAGLAQAMSMGARAVLLINSDAVLEQGSLGYLLTGITKAAVAVPRNRPSAGAKIVSLCGYYHRAAALNLRTQHVGCLKYVSGCCMLLRVDVITLPLLDEAFFFYGEDVALSRDLQERNISVVECPQAVIVHRRSGSAKNGSLFYEYNISRGHWLLAARLARNPLQKALYIAGRCVMLPLRATLRCLRSKSLVPWRGLIAASLDMWRGRMRPSTPRAHRVPHADS